MRTQEWLYVCKENRLLYLFDQINDRAERHNLVGEPEYADILASLDTRVGDNVLATGDAWHLQMDFTPPDFMTHKQAHRYLLDVVNPCSISVP